MKNLKTMSYNELEKETIEIAKTLRANMLGSKKISLEKERTLIARSQDLKVEMDRRWNTGKIKTRVIA